MHRALASLIADRDRLAQANAEQAQEIETLKMRVAGIQCDLQRAVVPDELENMVRQVISDRTELLRQEKDSRRRIDDLRAEVATLTATVENAKKLLMQIHDNCAISPNTAAIIRDFVSRLSAVTSEDLKRAEAALHPVPVDRAEQKS